MIKKAKKHAKETYWSMQNAMRGIWFGYGSERNFRTEIYIIFGAILLSIYLDLNYLEYSVVFLASSVVLGAELLNTAIEESWNKLHPDQHHSVGRIKDIASGGVFLVGLGAALAGSAIFIHHIF